MHETKIYEAAKKTTEDARSTLKTKTSAVDAAERAYENDPSDRTWKAVAEARAARDRAELDVRAATKREAEAKERLEAAERLTKTERLEQLRASSSWSAFRDELAPHVSAIVEAERAIATAIGSLRAVVAAHCAARLEAEATASDLGTEHGVPHLGERHAAGIVAHAIHKSGAADLRMESFHPWINFIASTDAIRDELARLFEIPGVGLTAEDIEAEIEGGPGTSIARRRANASAFRAQIDASEAKKLADHLEGGKRRNEARTEEAVKEAEALAAREARLRDQETFG